MQDVTRYLIVNRTHGVPVMLATTEEEAQELLTGPVREDYTIVALDAYWISRLVASAVNYRQAF
jgi:hypothetical protein